MHITIRWLLELSKVTGDRKRQVTDPRTIDLVSISELSAPDLASHSEALSLIHREEP
jgi:hypothetical protein